MADDKKKYMWIILYLVLIITGQQLAGIGGLVGAAIIAFGIHRTVKNPDLSSTKKWIYSILYTIGGLVAAFIIVILFTGVFAGIFGSNYLANVDSDDNIEEGYTTETGFKTFESKNLEIRALSYPEDWTASEDKQTFQAVFESPDGITSFSVTLYGLEPGQTLDFNTYVADVMKAIEEDLNFSFEKTGEQVKTINGRDWLIFEGVLILEEGRVYENRVYEKIAVVLTGKYEGIQYLEFVLGTDEASFPTESARLDQIIESLRIYS